MQMAARGSRDADPKEANDQSPGELSLVDASRVLGRNIDDCWSFRTGSLEDARGRAAKGARVEPCPCPSIDRLRAFIDGRLGADEVASVDTHIAACTSCSTRVLEALSARSQPPTLFREPKASCLSFDLGACLAERYLVYRPLGQGGMGEVYEAFDVERQRPVAIKTILARTCDNPEALRRLTQEYELARRVRHPSVRRMYQLGVHEAAEPGSATFPFISMELIEGESLARQLRPGGLGLARFAGIASALFRGVAAIHAAGIVHRDIKSHNVLLRAKPAAPLAIIDFGLAIEASAVGHASSTDNHGSTARSLEGSPAYMAPEQFGAADVSFASDVFSCGVVLFQVLTGTFPFRSLSRRHSGARRNPREVPSRVRAVAPDLPAWIDAFVGRCLELDAGARFEDAAEALEALERGLAAER